VLSLFLLCFPVFSQEDGGTEPVIEGPKPDSVFVINSFDINIKGTTNPYAVIYKAELKKGEEINGLAQLEKYIADKKQLLSNERILETVSIDYTTGEASESGKIPVDLVINIVDTWNIIIIPYPKYSSNSGLELTIKARDYNFLGTMNPLKLDLGYKYDEEQRNSIFFELDSYTPFTAFGFNWYFKFFHSFYWRPDTEQPYYYMNITGLSMELPVKSTTVTFGFDESILFNEENSDFDKPFYGSFQDGLYMSSNPYISWKIPTGIEIGYYGDLVYTPKISAVFNHEFPQWPLAEIRKGPVLTFDHNLGFNRVDWIGNYRRGFDVFAYNSFSFNFYKMAEDVQPWEIDMTFSGTGHFIITGIFGISTRLMYRQWFFLEGGYREAGDALRGVLDKAISADSMLSLNLDFPVKAFSFLPSVCLGNQKFRFFDFDFHFSPIIDMALYNDPMNKISFNFRNILVSGGLELIVFPAFMRSLYLRLSLAWNFVEQINNPGDYYFHPVLPVIPNLPMGSNREIFFGLGHHY
jgi:hypothetical protein